MQPRNSGAGIQPLSASAVQLLDRFEQAWQGKTPPQMEEFLAPASDRQTTDASRQELLKELIKIDLEYRWRTALPSDAARGKGDDCRLVEKYTRRYPELLQQEPLLVELIGEEYRARQRWGDRPGHSEYSRRFPDRSAKLREVLGRVDTELAEEFVREGGRPLLGNPAVAQPVQVLERRPMVQAVVSTTTILDGLRQSQLLGAEQLSELVQANQQGRFADPRAMARYLMDRGWLTPYQVNQVFAGRGQELVLGPYLVLERLGEGGGGQVFKARHQHMQRLVALKMLRKELLADTEAIDRFRREMQALGQLSHPNVVLAHDAGPLGANYFLVMEYVEGIDLGRLVKQKGPLPVDQARAYIRQVALGLQYIHERGLVHRDIKPSNLLLTGGAVTPATPHPLPLTPHQVKILDLGLARLQRPAAAGTLTAPGAVMMGTLDFMAPEQALDFHTADIRADIYSLGCTLYYLLASRPPFPEGTAAQKLVLHQMKEPPPVEQFRADLPASLPSVLRKMMAKRPEDRYQTPAEVAQALDGAPANPANMPAVLPPLAALPPPVTVRYPVVVPPGPIIVVDGAGQRRVGTLQRARHWLQRQPRWRGMLVTVVAATMALGLVTALVILLLPARTVYLSDMTEQRVNLLKFSKGGRVMEQEPIKWEKQLSPHGLYTLPAASSTGRVSYRLNKQYRRFKTVVAFNDTASFTQSQGAVMFRVLGDGGLIWESKFVGKPQDWQECDKSVEGVDWLELVVHCPTYNQDIGGAYICPVWIEPHVIK